MEYMAATRGEVELSSSLDALLRQVGLEYL
jgi:hypothetical protein